jgi:hypothetical protein
MITSSVISRTVKRKSAGIFSRTWATPSSLRAVESQPGTQDHLSRTLGPL